MTKLNYILISIIVILLVFFGWFYFDYEPKKEPTETEKVLIQAINELNQRTIIMERFMVVEFQDKVAEFNEKLKKGEI